MKTTTTLWTALFFFLFFLAPPCVSAQSVTSSTLTGKYLMKDSVNNNQDAVLLLGKDSIYVNYGIFTDRTAGDFYIWYSAGKFSLKGNSVICTSNEKMCRDPELIQQIKNSYILRKDHALIVNYYEFVVKEYSAYEFSLNADSITDKEKKINYKK